MAQSSRDSSTAPSTGKVCHADRTQRRHCRHYHEKTGRCTEGGGTNDGPYGADRRAIVKAEAEGATDPR